MAMIRPETEMKDSGIEWEKIVPIEWNKCILKDYFEFEKGKNAQIYTKDYIGLHKGNFPVYSGQTENDGVMGEIDTYDYELDECLFSTTVGAKVMTPKVLSGKFSLSQNCLIMRKIRKCVIRFVYYALFPLFDYERTKIPAYMQPSLRIEDLKSYKLYMPLYTEQQAIADYLDETCSKIDEIIAEAKASIDEYKELKQSVIFEAVTKGLDKNVEMKDSGTQGMGFIPTKWSVVRFMKVNYVRARLGWKGLKAEEYVDVGYPFLAAYHIVNSHLCWKNLNCITKERYNESPEIKLSIGDLVLVKDGAGIGKCARIDEMPLGEATVNSSLSVITPNELLDYRYEYYYFMSPLFQNIIARLKNGMGVPHLTQESMKDIYLPLPSKKEQRAIADYLDNKVVELDSLMSEKESLINDLEAYKKSLIYEVVTGKRRVV